MSQPRLLVVCRVILMSIRVGRLILGSFQERERLHNGRLLTLGPGVFSLGTVHGAMAWITEAQRRVLSPAALAQCLLFWPQKEEMAGPTLQTVTLEKAQRAVFL